MKQTYSKSEIYRRIIKHLKISKPLVFFDLKTTGPAISIDKIFEIAYIKILPNGRIIKDNFMLNPEIDISEEAIEFHNISNEALANKQTFRQREHEIWDIFYGCYLAGFNIIDFDLPILRREFARVGRDFEYSTDDIIDSKVIFQYMEPNTLSVVYNHYCGKEYLSANNAMRDVEAALEIFNKQFGKYKEVRDRKFLNDMYALQDERLRGHERKFYWRDGDAYFNFSKYQDSPLCEVARFDPDYLKWMLEADFSKEIKSIVRKALRDNEK